MTGRQTVAVLGGWVLAIASAAAYAEQPAAPDAPTTAPHDRMELLASDPATLLAAAGRAEAGGDWESAIALYVRAASLTEDPSVRESAGIAAGDLCWAVGREGVALRLYAAGGGAEGRSVPALSRQVRLGMAIAGAFRDEQAATQLAGLARRLIDLAPDDPLGPHAAAIAAIRRGGAEDLDQALAHLERMRKLAPDDPRGCFLAAAILHDRPGDARRQAEQLLNFVPDGAAADVRSRFRLVRLTFQLREVLAGEGAGGPARDRTGGLAPDAAAELIRSARDTLDEVTDGSRMTVGERRDWARLAAFLGRHELAEKIYLALPGDRTAVLSELSDPPASRALLERLREQEPLSLYACTRLVPLYISQGKPEQADRYIRLGLDLPKVDSGLMGAWQASNRYALEMFRIQRVWPESADAAAPDWAKFRTMLEEVAASYPNQAQADPRFYRMTAGAAMALNDPAAAVGALTAALKLLEQEPRAKPAALETVLLLAQLLMRLDRPGDAEPVLRQARALAPGFEPLAALLGQALARQGKWQEIVDEAPRWIAAVGPSVAVCLQWAAALKALDRADEMPAVLDRAVEATGGRPEVIETAAARLADALGPEAAEKWLDGWVRRLGEQIGPRIARAGFWARRGQTDRAVADLKELARKHAAGPDAVSVRFNLGMLLGQARRFNESADAYRQAIELSGEQPSPVVLNNYAYLLADNLDRAAEAIPLAEQAAHLTGRSEPNVLDTLGWAYVRAGRAGDGVAVLEQAFNAGRSPVACYHLAVALKAVGQLDRARRRARQAVELFGADSDAPDAAAARRLLEELTAGADSQP